MESSARDLTDLVAPFPGLRAFETRESRFFFGRETHIEELLWRLSENRFLAIVGSSGCGKSSLVRAGLLPALFRGYLVNATSRWRCAILRPGPAPIDALAAALVQDGALGFRDATVLRETLGATSGGLAAAVREASLEPGESLLVVVDQFEEIFRFSGDGREGEGEGQASLFVSLLLHAVGSDAPVYVSLTMRSDFQGDCVQFPGLAEALNSSQYLVPRLTRDQRREAVVRPLELVGSAATPRLVNRLLNDAGDDPDQLPVLQHALLRMYRRWRTNKGKGSLDVADYEAVGGVAEALARHGNEILGTFTAEDQRLAQKIFRCLTTTERGRVARRPTRLADLYKVVNATDKIGQSRVKAIVTTFADPTHSLLMLSSPELVSDTVVDITHESLMRKWPALEEWVKEEERSADWYRDLARDALRHRTDESGLWRDPELSGVVGRRDGEGWNEAWAHQCSQPGDPPFDEVDKFLKSSVKVRTKRRFLALILWLLSLVSASLLLGLYVREQQSKRTIAELSREYDLTQGAYTAKQQEASQFLTRYLDAQRQLRAADPNEQVKLRQELESLKRDYNDSQSKADDYERMLAAFRKNQDATTLNNRKLAVINENLAGSYNDLQEQFKAAKAEREQLQEEWNTNASRQQNELSYWKNRALAYERSTAKSQQAVARTVFKVVQQYSLALVTDQPFAGRLAIGVGDIEDRTEARLNVYIWAADRRELLPDEFRANEVAANGLEKKNCPDSARGLWCYVFVPTRNDTMKGKQRPGQFYFNGARYEIQATGWNSGFIGIPDSISLALYPAP